MSDLYLSPGHCYEGTIIKELIYPDDSTNTVGESKLGPHYSVVEIVPYSEPGDMGYSLWFEIRFVDGHRCRVNSRYVATVVLEV